jgi:hypothetical protein
MWQASSSPPPPCKGTQPGIVAASKPCSSASRHCCLMAAIWGPGMDPPPPQTQPWESGVGNGVARDGCVVWVWLGPNVGCLPRSANPRAAAPMPGLWHNCWSNTGQPKGNKNGSSWCGMHSRAVKQEQPRTPLHTHSAARAPQAALVLMAC